jgi:putative flippase GtrA
VVRGLYERFQQLIHEAAKFGVVGIVGVLITNGGYALLHNTFGTGPVTATTIATIVATAVSYVANRSWSFRHRERTSVAREGTIFFVLNGIGLGIQDAVVAFNYYILGLGGNKLAEFLALNAGIALATVFRFWSYRKFVWAAPSDDAGAKPAASETAPPGGPQGTGRDGRFRAVTVAPGSTEHTNGDAAADRASRAAENGSFSRR